jgi:hypothetical protein
MMHDDITLSPMTPCACTTTSSTTIHTFTTPSHLTITRTTPHSHPPRSSPTHAAHPDPPLPPPPAQSSDQLAKATPPVDRFPSFRPTRSVRLPHTHSLTHTLTHTQTCTQALLTRRLRTCLDTVQHGRPRSPHSHHRRSRPARRCPLPTPAVRACLPRLAIVHIEFMCSLAQNPLRH